jgi:hypothetical protein
MDQIYTTPLYVLIRHIDYDPITDTISALSPNSPCLIIIVDGLPCYPVFTSIEAAKKCRDVAGKTDSIVSCDRFRLRKILFQNQSLLVAIDPTGITGLPVECYAAMDFLDLVHDSGPGIQDS